ncbi:unnamed protein product [Macrosiphum euphorbiae]|uniref:Transmembrane protein 65 n=1 Tax=Macrosiphum euphorbiae TaxID=13131 RepID=A0AAV0XAE2_9HEMI|nr:unnamed protein product [Macrosiphum euphorbiae]
MINCLCCNTLSTCCWYFLEFGIGSSYYVEQLVIKLGLKPPNLTPLQLDMNCSRRAANLGRTLGVTLGCFLGMFPLLLKKDEESKDEKSVEEEDEK